MPKPAINCMYCGLHKPGSSEHVIQDALGGVDVLEAVCADCNRLLAANDRILVVESPLSILARQELGGHGPNSWDVDHIADNLLLESRLTLGAESMTLIPQLVFDRNEHLFYCDGDDILTLGAKEAQDRFYARLRSAFSHYKLHGPRARKRHHKGQDMLKLSPVDRIRSFYRLAPRICCSEPLTEFASGAIMFRLRYVNESDRDRVLDGLSKLDWSKRAGESRLFAGSELPEVRIQFSLTGAIQSLTKIGLNLVTFFSKHTTISRGTFARTIEWIMEGKHTSEFGDERSVGFVAPASIAELNCPRRAHKFRLTHDMSTNTWKMYAALFEGKAAAYVAFAGPNCERWGTMDVVAPYDRPMLTPSFDEWYRPLEPRIVINAPEMLPTVPFCNGKTRVRREAVPAIRR